MVALKSRTIEADRAISQSLAALAWLRAGRPADPVQVLLDLRFTERGNIGPVSEALLEALGADFTIACPALPENGAASTSATCSSASSCCPTATCATTRSPR